MSMLPKAARPFGTKISVVVKNGETQNDRPFQPKIFYFTVILIFAFLPLNVFAVMTAFPFLFAVILPFAFTEATDFLLEEYVIL